MFLNAQPCVLNKSLDVLSEFVFLFTHTSAERADAALICSFSGWKTPSEPAPFCSFSPQTHTYIYTAAQRRKAAAFLRHRMREERECVGCCAQRRGSCSSQSLLYVADKWSSLVTNRVPHANLARPRCCRWKIHSVLVFRRAEKCSWLTWCSQKIECLLKIKEELEAMWKLQSLISLDTKLVKIYVLKYQATGIIAKIQTNELSMGKSTVENIYWFLSSLSVIILLNLKCA